jgi:hypothetical protein
LNREAERRRQAKLRTGADRGWGLSIKAWTAFNLRARLTARAAEPDQPSSWFDVVAKEEAAKGLEAEAKVAQAQTGVAVDATTQATCPVCSSKFERICDTDGVWRYKSTVRPQRGPGSGMIFHVACFGDFMATELERIAAAANAKVMAMAEGAAGSAAEGGAKGEDEIDSAAEAIAEAPAAASRVKRCKPTVQVGGGEEEEGSGEAPEKRLRR